MPRTLQRKTNQKFCIAAFYTNTDRFYELRYLILISQTFFSKDLKLIV